MRMCEDDVMMDNQILEDDIQTLLNASMDYKSETNKMNSLVPGKLETKTPSA